MTQTFNKARYIQLAKKNQDGSLYKKNQTVFISYVYNYRIS